MTPPGVMKWGESFEPVTQAQKWYILGHKLALLATFFKISTSNLFCLAFTIRVISKPN